ncbi:MAG: FeoB small GTPase domain-containing protein [Gammaproteobacteria bacterium]
MFNVLASARQHVGNWAGVTVEKKTGVYRYCNKTVKVVDLPSIYARGINERDCNLSRQADLIVNIVDASHLEHNLYLTTQRLEMRLPMLNNMDDATGCGIKIDSDEIARRLGSPPVSLIARSLILSASAWSKTDCAVSTAGFTQTKIDHLGVQTRKTNSDIEKLQPVMAMAKADIAMLCNQEKGQS